MLVRVEAIVNQETAAVVSVGFHEAVVVFYVGGEEMTAPMRVVARDEIRIADFVRVLSLPPNITEPRRHIEESRITPIRVCHSIPFDELPPIARSGVPASIP